MERVAVLGAGGHIGTALCHELVSTADVEVTAVVRGTTPRPAIDPLGLEYLRADLDEIDYRRLCQDFDWIIDAAAPYPSALDTSADDLRKTFARYRRLLDAISASGIRYSYISSFITLPRQQSQLQALANATITRSHPYYVAKQRIEAMVLKARRQNQRVQVFCPTAFIGPWDPKPVESNLVLQLAHGLVPVVPNRVLNFIDVRDAAAALVRLAKTSTAEKIPLLGHRMSIADFSAKVAQLANVEPPLAIPTSSIATNVSMLGLEAGLKVAGVEKGYPGLVVLLCNESYEFDSGTPLTLSQSVEGSIVASMKE